MGLKWFVGFFLFGVISLLLNVPNTKHMDNYMRFLVEDRHGINVER